MKMMSGEQAGQVPEIDQNLNGLQSVGGHLQQWWEGAVM